MKGILEAAACLLVALVGMHDLKLYRPLRSSRSAAGAPGKKRRSR